MSGKVIDLTENDFEGVIGDSTRLVLVDFWAEWCAPCHLVAPIIEEIAREHPERVTVAKVNVDDYPTVAASHAVVTIPTLILFQGRRELTRIIGARGKEQIMQRIEEAA